MQEVKAQRKQQTVHFIGICGSGMSALAKVAQDQGYTVQGSDLQPAGPVAEWLETQGIKLFPSQSPQNVELADIIVFSSAVAPTNLEFAQAKNLQLPILHRSEFLAQLMQGRKTITVAGTHGKTTVSSMLAYTLDQLGADPSFAIGGFPRDFPTPGRQAKGGFFVAEADESDGSFLKYEPFVGVLTNVDRDHLEFFGGEAGLVKVFQDYTRRVHPDGCLVVNWDSPLARQVAEGVTTERLTYGSLIGAEFRLTGWQQNGRGVDFSAVAHRDLVHGHVEGFGIHSATNALACLAVCHFLGFSLNTAIQALATFKGVRRRHECYSDQSNFLVFDDYAHNPGKIRACLSGIRNAFPQHRFVVLFQNHRYSRLRTMYDDLLGSFSQASEVYVLPVYSAGESTTEDYSATRLATDLSRLSKVPATACPTFDFFLERVKSLRDQPTVLLTLGAGDVWKVAQQLTQK